MKKVSFLDHRGVFCSFALQYICNIHLMCKDENPWVALGVVPAWKSTPTANSVPAMGMRASLWSSGSRARPRIPSWMEYMRKESTPKAGKMAHYITNQQSIHSSNRPSLVTFTRHAVTAQVVSDGARTAPGVLRGGEAELRALSVVYLARVSSWMLSTTNRR